MTSTANRALRLWKKIWFVTTNTVTTFVSIHTQSRPVTAVVGHHPGQGQTSPIVHPNQSRQLYIYGEYTHRIFTPPTGSVRIIDWSLNIAKLLSISGKNFSHVKQSDRKNSRNSSLAHHNTTTTTVTFVHSPSVLHRFDLWFYFCLIWISFEMWTSKHALYVWEIIFLKYRPVFCHLRLFERTKFFNISSVWSIDREKQNERERDIEKVKARKKKERRLAFDKKNSYWDELCYICRHLAAIFYWVFFVFHFDHPKIAIRPVSQLISCVE